LIVSSVTPYVASSFHHWLPSVNSEVFSSLLSILGDILTFLEKITRFVTTPTLQSRIQQVDDR
jgi:hypothetical protein